MTDTMQSPAQSLPDEQAALQRLVGKLRQEQTLLAETSAEGMTELITEKANIVAEMTTLAGTRHLRLAAAGFASDEAGVFFRECGAMRVCAALQ